MIQNKLDEQYINLLKDILENGATKGDRTGTGTISVFGRQIRHKMSDGFPLLTTKQMPFKSMVTELIWFLRGDTNIKFLVDQKCNIWNGDAYKNYLKLYNERVSSGSGSILKGNYKDRVKWGKSESYFKEDHGNGGMRTDVNPFTMEEFVEKIKTDDEFAEKWGDLGPIYGSQWRNWKGFKHGWHDVAKTIDGKEPHIDWLEGIDQIINLIHELKNNPDSRRLLVNAWNVAEIDGMVLPPCHYGFQLYTRNLTYAERYDMVAGKGVWDDNMKNMEEGKSWYLPTSAICAEVEKLIPKKAVSLMWNQRSVDTFLGLPFNIASYGLLLLIIAEEVNMVPDELIGNLGDTHLYSNHLDAAKEQITRTGFSLPTVNINKEFWNPDQVENLDFGTIINSMCRDDFQLSNYQHEAKIEAPLSN